MNRKRILFQESFVEDLDIELIAMGAKIQESPVHQVFAVREILLIRWAKTKTELMKVFVVYFYCFQITIPV